MQSLETLIAEATALLEGASSNAELENLKARYLGKSGELTEQLKGLGKLPAPERPAAGSRINEAKARLETVIDARREALARAELDRRLAEEALDVTLPGRSRGLGGIHPLIRTWQRIETIFRSIGFDVA